jgi:hypothetical protein
VRATLGGTHVNTTGNITSNENTAGGTATATLQVASTIPSITKSFSPTTVVVNNTSTLTLTLTNPNPVPITGVAFTDNFAAQGLVITSAAPTGTPLCTGTITAAQNTSLVSLSGGTLAANSSCQIVVTVRATLVGTQVNRTSTLTSNEFGPGAAAEASLVVTAAPTPVVPSPTPTATSTPTLVPPPPPVIPQVFQNPLALGVVQAGNRQTPTPVRPALAPAAVAPILVPIQPPRTGDAGLLGALAQALDE